MELTPEEMDQIEAYWKGTSTPEDRVQIEARMQSDPEYREEVELFGDLFLVIEKSGDLALKQYLDQVREKAEEKQEPTPPPTVPEDSPIIPLRKTRFKYLVPIAVAASVIIGILLVWRWQNRPNPHAKLYATVDEAYQTGGLRTFPLPMKGQGYVSKEPLYDSLLQAIDTALRAGNANEIVQLAAVFKQKYPDKIEFFVNYPLAHAYFARENWNEAVRLLKLVLKSPDPAKVQEVEWLLMLANGHVEGQEQEAKRWLNKIISNPTHKRYAEAKKVEQSWPN